MWELASLGQDVKDAERRALGIELRSTSVEAGVVQLDETEEEAMPPSRVELPSHTSPGEFANLLSDAIGEAIAPFGPWKGVVGCALTPKVLELLGQPTDAGGTVRLDGVLRRSGLKPSFVHSMEATEAAGYAEIETLRARGEPDGGLVGPWRKLVLVATLGANFGGVLFNDGHRVRRGGIPRLEVPDWSDKKLPKPGEEEWEGYIELADDFIMRMVEHAAPDHVILIPTGAAATRKERLPPGEFLPQLRQTMKAAEEKGFSVAGAATSGNSVVRGAALSAIVELRSVRARLAIRKALEGAISIEQLSPPQLRAVFDAFNDDADEKLTQEELERALEALGLTHDVTDAFEDDLFSEDESAEKYMTFADFCKWWDRCILSARVLSVRSFEALQQLVGKPPSEVPKEFGPLLLAEITFSFCRTCKRFARKYERLATEHPDIRFVTIVANHNRKTMEESAALNINKAPAFLLYRRGTDISSPLAMWFGANVERCEEALKGALVTMERTA